MNITFDVQNKKTKRKRCAATRTQALQLDMTDTSWNKKNLYLYGFLKIVQIYTTHKERDAI
jgi:hypothetical protein